MDELLGEDFSRVSSLRSSRRINRKASGEHYAVAAHALSALSWFDANSGIWWRPYPFTVGLASMPLLVGQVRTKMLYMYVGIPFF